MTAHKLRLRFAPSPTGHLHVGGARTALYNYLFCQKNKADFILRIEDTDESRSSEAYIKSQIEDLKWMGLSWDEGLDLDEAGNLVEKGDKAPYRQSLRLSLYEKYAKKLISENKAYYCFLTDDQIKEQKDKAIKEKKAFRVISPYRDLDPNEALKKIKKGEKASLRFKVISKNKYCLKDEIRGEINFHEDSLGDFILLRSNGMPVYNFCCVIDDYLMQISHVFRAEDHLNNSLRQLMLYEAFNWKPPLFIHLSLIVDENKQKLSKRLGSVSVCEFKKESYLSGAFCNFLALLGWSHPEGKEILSKKELKESFSIKRLNPSSAIFDLKKLNWMNGEYLKNDTSLIQKIVKEVLEAKLDQYIAENKDWEVQFFNYLKEQSFSNQKELKEVILSFKSFTENTGEKKEDFLETDLAKEVFSWDKTLKVIQSFHESLKKKEKFFLNKEDLSEIFKDVQEKNSVKGKFLFMPLRLVSSLNPQGADLKLLIPLIPRSILEKRSLNLISHLKGK